MESLEVVLRFPPAMCGRALEQQRFINGVAAAGLQIFGRQQHWAPGIVALRKKPGDGRCWDIEALLRNETPGVNVFHHQVQAEQD